jgi:serpin B
MSKRSPSERFVEASNAAAHELFQALAPPGENFVFSPASLRLCLAMAWIGAKGETERQFAEVLGFPERSDYEVLREFRAFLAPFQEAADEHAMSIANGAWFDERLSLAERYGERLAYSFFAKPRAADFAGAPEAACDDINAWVRAQSAGRLEQIIQPRELEALTAMILVNLVYFKGRWTEPFLEEFTEDAPFRLAGGGTVPARLMGATNEYDYFEDDTLQAIELTYEDTDLAFLALLPRDDSTPGAGLEALESELGRGLLRRVVAGLERQKVALDLPKFELDTGELHCIRALESMGLTLPFDLGRADFGGITGRECDESTDARRGTKGMEDELFLSGVLHQAMIEVDEQGTAALALTRMGAIAAPMGVERPPPPPIFRADHPFLFLLRQRSTGAIVFMGRLMAPSGAA